MSAQIASGRGTIPKDTDSRQRVGGISGRHAPGAIKTEMAGYSETPLAQKLGIKAGQRVVTIGAPAGYRTLLVPLPDAVAFTKQIGADPSFLHLFVAKRATLEQELGRLRKLIADAGVLWVSWPKKSSGVVTDVTEDVIRDVALPLGFVDVKVCAVDATWSGLKLMIRRGNRR